MARAYVSTSPAVTPKSNDEISRESQMVAAVVTYGVLVFAWFATWNEAAIGERVAPVLLALSLFDHFYGFAQGVIDSRDVVYFLAFAAFCLFLALRALGARAWRGLA